MNEKITNILKPTKLFTSELFGENMSQATTHFSKQFEALLYQQCFKSLWQICWSSTICSAFPQSYKKYLKFKELRLLPKILVHSLDIHKKSHSNLKSRYHMQNPYKYIHTNLERPDPKTQRHYKDLTLAGMEKNSPSPSYLEVCKVCKTITLIQYSSKLVWWGESHGTWIKRSRVRPEILYV